MSGENTLSLILVGVFLVFSAFFSSSEAAFLSLQRGRLAHLVSTRAPGARLAASMIRNPERLLSTILLGNNLVNVAFTAVITALFLSWMSDEGTALIAATVSGTVLLLLFGEIVPKTVAVYRSEIVALAYARPLKTIELLLLPVVVVLDWTTQRLGGLLSGGRGTRRAITESEVRALIDIGEAEGTFEKAEADMLENVFRFGDRQVRESMTPRTEIISIRRGFTLGEFLDMYATHAHTRFPVYKDSVDDIIGIISAKDVLKAMANKSVNYDDSVTDVIRDAYFVPETKRVADLFDELRQSGNQMAMVVDEFGGLAGLVTLKRLVEEIVGAVGEEGSGPADEYETIDENTFQIEGGMGIEQVQEELGISLPDGEFETIAGFVLDVLGRIPSEGDQFEFHDLKFEITQMKQLKIETVTVTRTVKAEEDAATVETDPG